MLHLMPMAAKSRTADIGAESIGLASSSESRRWLSVRYKYTAWRMLRSICLGLNAIPCVNQE